MNKIDAIYGRQSVDRADSISIESQIEFCQYETRGGAYRVFQDKGYSGKNTDRPQFQQMLECVRNGEIKRVIVYKLDRISRSILDFATMMEEFQAHGVEFVSCTEKFDTSTPMGRAMLNICIVFAQLERETIQMRVTDAYMSRSRKGFYMGGPAPYGYRLEPYTIDGKKTSHYTVVPSEAEIVKVMFDLYSQPHTSMKDVLAYFQENGIRNCKTKDGSWSKDHLAALIKNPVYVRADLDLYKFYKSQGTIIHSDPEDFTGTNGCYLYQDKNATYKTLSLVGQHLVIAPHEGIIPSDIWIKARMKCLKNKSVPKPIKGGSSWLLGKIKCPKCGYALEYRGSRKPGQKMYRYFFCSHRMKAHACEGIGGIRVEALEEQVLRKMSAYVKKIDTLTQTTAIKESPKIHDLNVKIESINNEIESLLDKLSSANDVLMEYINKRIKELSEQLSVYTQELQELTLLHQSSKCDIEQLRDYMDHWEDLDFDEKRSVADQILIRVTADKDGCDIIWRI